jgi:hypothetical protein
MLRKGRGWERNGTFLKVPLLFFLVLLVKVRWEQSKSLGNEEGKVMELDSEYAADEISSAFGLSFVFEGLHRDDNLIKM